MGRPNFAFAGVCALVMTVAMVLVAWDYHLPVRDPDGVVVPMYLQLPLIVFCAWLLDVLPRAVWQSRHRLRETWPTLRTVISERWDRKHWFFALSGLGAWYVCYATFRNLKSYVPFVHHRLFDSTLASIDRTIWLGHDPAVVLHDLFGTGAAAELFSFVYVAWIVLIPVTLAIALVWTRAVAAGSWFVTAVAADWLLGVATYYLVPTLGPIYSAPQNFAALRHTYATTLENNLMTDREAVLADPHATHAVQTIAAFPSLHVGMMVTVALMVTLIGLPRWLRAVSWVFLVLTVLATIYLGWHFFTDVVGGLALGTAAVWIAALGTGNHVRGRPHLVDREPKATAQAPEAEPAGTSVGRRA